MNDLPKLQFEAAWCLTNNARGDHEYVHALKNEGTVNAFVSLLNS